jgi:hypothetical protein
MNLSMADLRNYWTEFHKTWWSYRYMFLIQEHTQNDIQKERSLKTDNNWTLRILLDQYNAYL